MALRVHETTVHGWVLRFKTAGLDGLKESPRSGAKRKLPADQEAKFKDAVIDLQEQRSGGRITGHDVRTLLEEQFQVNCCLNSVYNLLARLSLVWITVRSKHPKQSQASQDTFKKTFATR
jgi:transposase